MVYLHPKASEKPRLGIVCEVYVYAGEHSDKYQTVPKRVATALVYWQHDGRKTEHPVSALRVASK